MKTPPNPKYHRQRYILAMLDLAGNSLSKMDLQKLLFLSQNETSANYFDFVPYHYGCYSFQAAADVERLQSLEWLEVKDKVVSLRHRMHWSTLVEKEGRELWRLMTLYKNVRGRDLVKSVYERYPFYAINSRIAKEVASDDALEKIRELKKLKAEPEQKILYTIGYEGLSFEAYANKLIRSGVRLLCDVRKNPLSRKFGFSKGSLSELLPKLGIEYVHIPELGIVSEKRKQLTSDADYRRLFEEYRGTLAGKDKYLADVTSLLEQYGKVALTCFEHHHKSCHRHCVSDQLSIDRGIKVLHL